MEALNVLDCWIHLFVVGGLNLVDIMAIKHSCKRLHVMFDCSEKFWRFAYCASLKEPMPCPPTVYDWRNGTPRKWKDLFVLRGVTWQLSVFKRYQKGWLHVMDEGHIVARVHVRGEGVEGLLTNESSMWGSPGVVGSFVEWSGGNSVMIHRHMESGPYWIAEVKEGRGDLGPALITECVLQAMNVVLWGIESNSVHLEEIRTLLVERAAQGKPLTFLDLGIESILEWELVRLVNDKLGTASSLSALIDYRTVEEYVEFLCGQCQCRVILECQRKWQLA